MERSWGIVLVLLLISITSYAQLSSGTIANNRFLQRVNPAIDRALADSGSSLDHPEIQRLARQMVDLGLWNDLVLWVHEGLIKERVSGSDVFASTGYDIGSLALDVTSVDSTSEPKVLSDHFLFDNVNDILRVTHADSSARKTIIMYVNHTENSSSNRLFAINGSFLFYFQSIINNKGILTYDTGTGVTAGIWQTQSDSLQQNTWYHIAATYDGTSLLNDPVIYINGSSKVVTETNTPIVLDSIGNILLIGNRNLRDRAYGGKLSDIRYFKRILTAAEINAIFEETRSKYGL